MAVDLAAVERVVDEAAPRLPGLAVGVVCPEGDPTLFLRGFADVTTSRFNDIPDACSSMCPQAIAVMTMVRWA